ncbi:MAG: HEAT repeat domain-containing protein [Oligoflexales bacterium]|nr:HEAT repeat domain-containing protein [Oligoflexales bacterium]
MKSYPFWLFLGILPIFLTYNSGLIPKRERASHVMSRNLQRSSSDTGTAAKEIKLPGHAKSNISEQASAGKKIDPKLEKILKQIDLYKNCALFDECYTDPYQSFDLDPDLIKGMVGTIKSLAEFKCKDPSQTIFIADKARELLLIDNSMIRIAAMEVIKTLPKDQDTLTVLLSILTDDIDERVFKAAIPMIQQYTDKETSQQIREFLELKIKNGDHYVCAIAASQILGFLNNDNIKYYEKMLMDLPAKSSNYVELKKVLETYKKSQSLNGMSMISV